MARVNFLSTTAASSPVIQETPTVIAQSILTHRGGGVLPYVEQFYLDMSDEDKRNCQVKWTIEGENITYNKLDPKRPMGNNGNTHFGFMTAFHIKNNNTVIKCEIRRFNETTNKFEYQELSYTATGTDPDVFYEGLNIAYDPTGQFIDAPEGVKQVTTTSQVQSEIEAQNFVARVYVARGQELGNIYLRPMNGDDPQIHFLPFGPGTEKWIIKNSGSTPMIFSQGWQNNPNFANYYLGEVAYNGEYDPSTGEGKRSHVVRVDNYLGIVDVVDFEFHCGMQNFSCPYTGDNALNLFDGLIDGWEDYGGYIGCNRFSSVGVWARQRSNTINGSENKSLGASFNSPDHGPFRTAFADHVIITMSDGFCKNGWSSAGWGYQPVYRLNANQPLGFYGVVSQCTGQGGGQFVTSSAMNGDTVCRPSGACVVEMNYFVGGHATRQMVATTSSNWVCRWNIFVMPDIPNFGALDSIGTFADGSVTSGGGHADGNENGEMLVYGNSLIDLRKTTISQSKDISSGYNTFINAGYVNTTFENNLTYAPNRNTPDKVVEPLDNTPTIDLLDIGIAVKGNDAIWYADNISTGFGSGWTAEGNSSGAIGGRAGDGRFGNGSYGYVHVTGSTAKNFTPGEIVTYYSDYGTPQQQVRGTVRFVRMINPDVDGHLSEYAQPQGISALYYPKYGSLAKQGSILTSRRPYWNIFGKIAPRVNDLGAPIREAI